MPLLRATRLLSEMRGAAAGRARRHRPQATREERVSSWDYVFRFGAITALLMAGVLMLARLPTCPDWTSPWSPLW